MNKKIAVIGGDVRQLYLAKEFLKKGYTVTVFGIDIPRLDENDNLTYIKTIKGSYQELLKIKVEKQVEDSLFEIPSNYAEN